MTAVIDQIKNSVTLFFLSPAIGRPLAAVRIGMSLLLLLQALALRNSRFDFLASDGLVQGALSQYFVAPHTPHLRNMATWFSSVGISEMGLINIVCISYVAALTFLLLGFHTRLAAIATWFLHWTIINTGYATNYGIDIYAHVFLFYLMLSPCGDDWSIDEWMGRTNCTPTPGKRLAIRVMQLHLCITYLCSGLMKSAGEQWWNGELLWRSLNLPVYRQFDMTWLANWPALLVVGGWLTLFLEIGYCIFIWHRNTRWIWIIAMLGLHLGIAIFLGLQFFGFTMCILTFSVFGISSEEGRLFAMGWNFNVPQLNAQRNGEFA